MTVIHNVKDLGNMVRSMRKSQGITQKALAATSGVGVRFIRELEKGKESCHMGKSLEMVAMLGGTLVLKAFDAP